MLKWSARAFAMAAALQFGLASAQDVDANADLNQPGPTGPAVDAELGAGTDAEEEALEALDDSAERQQEAREEGQQEAREELQDAREDSIGEAREAREDAAEQQEATEREARFRPDAAGQQQGISERVRAATANLDIDDETRSRYRWHNGEWWFKTRSGNWKIYREGRWQDFDPATYQPMNSGAGYGAPQAGYDSGRYGNSGSYAAPQQYGASDGYYNQGRFNQTARPYGAYRPNYDRFDGNRYYNDGLNRGYYGNQGFNQGFYGNQNPGFYGNQGFGYQGYNPATDRFQGYNAYGQPYSISGDRYRGGVIGSEIGGRIGGNTGAAIGGAIGAEAAE